MSDHRNCLVASVTAIAELDQITCKAELDHRSNLIGRVKDALAKWNSYDSNLIMIALEHGEYLLELKHGSFKKELLEHFPSQSYQTLNRWMLIAKNRKRVEKLLKEHDGQLGFMKVLGCLTGIKKKSLPEPQAVEIHKQNLIVEDDFLDEDDSALYHFIEPETTVKKRVRKQISTDNIPKNEYLIELNVKLMISGKGLKQNQIQAVLGGGWKSKAHKDCELTHFEFISEPNVIQEESPEEDIN
jgi:hypothetical protein